MLSQLLERTRAWSDALRARDPGFFDRLSREQLADYAQRKGVPQAQAERWLAANLDYDPD